ncbi:hypothetical protein P7M41_25405, partial [Vibrio parahaemolyticus]|nr:hypothetical protein [Vibrio parahaemolyticus]
CSAIYQSRSLWCELQSVGDIGHRDVCLLLNIMELEIMTQGLYYEAGFGVSEVTLGLTPA